MAKTITKKTAKKAVLIICTFKDEVKKLISEDGVLLVKISNILKTDVEGVQSMLKRDSQTLFHITILEAISDSLKIEMKDLKKCNR